MFNFKAIKNYGFSYMKKYVINKAFKTNFSFLNLYMVIYINLFYNFL